MGIVPNKTDYVRYFTYYLIFPDGESWVDQTPFIHALDFQLKQTVWRNDNKKLMDLYNKGETRWKDQNSVEHLVRIEDVIREKRWGVQKNLESLGQNKGESRLLRRKRLREQAKHK